MNDDVKSDDIIRPGMESLRELYKIGHGPSSSHTMGPEKICRYFLERTPEADGYKVILYGSLAKTGAGHGTDRIIHAVLGENAVVEVNVTESDLPHPNTMDLIAFREGSVLDRVRAMSIGGGMIRVEGESVLRPPVVFPHSGFAEIQSYCSERNMTLPQYVEQFDGWDIRLYLGEIWRAMRASVENGLRAEGILPGGLEVRRKARYLFSQKHIDESAETRENRMVCAYAFAVSEENAANGLIVTAPTCGAAGVLPAVLYHYQKKRGFSDEDIIDALETGGLIGDLIKTNASISGAECGCQAEVGTACAMAAAALGQLLGLDISQIEYAAEVSIEHHLGLTCDPICGLVQIPCIERNAVAAMRAIQSVILANFLTDTRKISLDSVIDTMRETGLDLSRRYKETSEGGLAKMWNRR